MTTYHWLLLLHLVGAFLLFGGAAVAGTLQLGALRRARPSEVLVLLQLTRVGVVLVGLGSVMTLVFGMALASHLGFGLSPAWVQASLGLWLVAMALGAMGGRTARHARYLAEKLVDDGDMPSAELRALLGHRPSLWASYASSAAIVAILVLMVWRPI